jgi:hypothetical protein
MDDTIPSSLQTVLPTLRHKILDIAERWGRATPLLMKTMHASIHVRNGDPCNHTTASTSTVGIGRQAGSSTVNTQKASGGVYTSVGLLCTGSQFNVRRVNILHRVGYQTEIRNVSLCCISLFQDAIPIQHWFALSTSRIISSTTPLMPRRYSCYTLRVTWEGIL